MVPGAGLEPARYRYRRILSRLPIDKFHYRKKLQSQNQTYIKFLKFLYNQQTKVAKKVKKIPPIFNSLKGGFSFLLHVPINKNQKDQILHVLVALRTTMIISTKKLKA